MQVGTKFKDYVLENYDVAHEEYYTTNVKYEYSKAWAMGGLKHAIVPLVGSVLASIFLPTGTLFNTATSIGVFTLAFILYGISSYVENSEEFSKTYYWLIVAAGLLTICKMAMWQQIMFALISNIAYIYISFIHPLWHFIHFRDFKKRDIDQESGKYAKEEQTYNEWRQHYDNCRKGLPSSDENKEDPVVAEARKLFEGYADTPQRLKARYRQLAKQYHPDRLGEGADDSMFKAIRYVFEDLQAKVGKA